MTDKEREIRQRLKDDFIHYASRCLQIRSKSGEIKPLALNRAQIYIHEQIEVQRKKTGKVRALILKGRQQGCSTYVEARFYWRVTHRKGVQAFILTHEQAATDNLFDMVTRYHDHCPTLVKPRTGASSAKELHFDLLDSGYKVGTAGTKGVGRSSTVQLFHGSEVGFWPNAETHAAGIIQAVPNDDETEIILESTANGIGNLFHQRWCQAEAGEGDYIAIFVPWYWQDEYQREPGLDFVLSPGEEEYRSLYRLTMAQMAWRRAKIEELGDESLFCQEYPATSAEAFRFSGESYVPAAHVMKARKTVIPDPFGALVMGVDPARFGDDCTAIIRRKGRKAYGVVSIKKKDTMEVAGFVVRAINAESPAKVFIDVIGLGAGVYDRLKEMGYGEIVVAVNSAETATDSDRYVNRRAEMWGEMKEWLADAPAQIPDRDDLHGDICAFGYSYDSKGRVKLESKDDVKERLKRSPDKGDALALTFAFPVRLIEPKHAKTNHIVGDSTTGY